MGYHSNKSMFLSSEALLCAVSVMCFSVALVHLSNWVFLSQNNDLQKHIGAAKVSGYLSSFRQLCLVGNVP